MDFSKMVFLLSWALPLTIKNNHGPFLSKDGGGRLLHQGTLMQQYTKPHPLLVLPGIYKYVWNIICIC